MRRNGIAAAALRIANPKEAHPHPHPSAFFLLLSRVFRGFALSRLLSPSCYPSSLFPLFCSSFTPLPPHHFFFFPSIHPYPILSILSSSSQYFSLPIFIS
ncbi:hypothetical protein AWENTII_001428 [Aspergillus wentii]